jgi:cell division protein FtsL
LSIISRAEIRSKLIESLKYNLLAAKSIFVLLLLIILIVTCISILSIKFDHRKLMISQQKNDQKQNELHVQWTQILLEHSTLASPILVESKARTKLNMIDPQAKNIERLSEQP